MWRLKKKVTELQTVLVDRCNSLEDALKIVVARGEVVQILKTEIELMREERKDLLNRLMARDFETLQTYTVEKEEDMGAELKPEEDEANAGEVFNVGN